LPRLFSIHGERFYQVFDRGAMRDGEGREIEFRNCVIVTASNLGGTLPCTGIRARATSMPSSTSAFSQRSRVNC